MITLNNPFRETIAATAWRRTCSDVSEVHANTFDVCLRGLEHVRSANASVGLLIHGEAGSGKTHLLGRLRTTLTSTHPISTDRAESLFVWVRLQTSPRAVWRHLRRQLVEDLLRRNEDQKSQFERILFHRLAEVRPAEGDLERWADYMREHNPEGLETALEEIATAIDLDRNTTVAFKHLAFERHRRDLRAWLCGDSLPEAALARIELTAEDGSEEDREQVARQLVLMLCRLAGTRLPIALCFDQVEALQISSDDREGLYAFGQLVSTLHDETSNLLIVSCVQSAYAVDLKSRSRGADHDRMTSWGAQSLEPLTLSQAEKVIAARLIAVGARGLWPLSPGWPLGKESLKQLVEPGTLTPRRLLTLCAAAFDQWASGTSEVAADVSITATDSVERSEAVMKAFLAADWEQRHESASVGNQSSQTDDIVRNGLPVLLKIVAPELNWVRDDHLQDVELVLESPSGKVGMSLCTHANMSSLAARLKRLKQQWASGRLKKLIVLRDSRVPISKTASKTLLTLDELNQAGAVVWHVSTEALIALDVLRGLMADAKSGDLSASGNLIVPKTVEDWLRQQLPACLQDVADHLIEDATDVSVGDAVALEAVATLLENMPVVALADIVKVVQRPESQVQLAIERHPDQFRVLKGPPVVVFRVS